MSFFAAVGRDAQHGAELGDAELRDQRRTLTRDRLLVLTPRDRVKVAAWWIDSGGCRSAHAAAMTSLACGLGVPPTSREA